MNRFHAILIAVSLISSSSVYAQLAQTYVSAVKGNDRQSCDFSRPCLTINRAISQTDVGGEVIIQDTGPYNPFTVSKTVTISAALGVQATVTASFPMKAGALISGGAQDFVTLRGLTINAQAAEAGILFSSGRTLLIESCTIDGSSEAGIDVEGPGEVVIKDTTVRNCRSVVDGDGVLAGFPGATPGSIKVTIEHCRFENNSHIGVLAADGSKVTVRDSVASGNNVGFTAGGSGTVEMNLENCGATDNGIGVDSNGTAPSTIRVSGSVITNNSIGVAAVLAGSVLSRGNNTVEGNNSDGSFTGFFVAK